MYFIIGFIFMCSWYSSYKIDRAHYLEKPDWALERTGELFFLWNSLLSSLFFVAVSIYGIFEHGLIVVLLCTIVIFPIVLTLLRGLFGDAILAYSGIIGYLFVIIYFL